MIVQWFTYSVILDIHISLLYMFHECNLQNRTVEYRSSVLKVNQTVFDLQIWY